MRAVTWHGTRDVRVETVPDPTIVDPGDAIVRISSTGLCGSDLHLYELLGSFMTTGDILGHEPMGYVEEVGRDVTTVGIGDRVVVPFNIACGSCHMCRSGLQSQCETTQVREKGTGAALFGYTKLYGQVPGGQASRLRVPHASYGLIKVPKGPPDDRFVYLSDVLPTAWQAVEYAGVRPGDSLVVLGLGPIGLMSCRVARHRGVGTIIAIDRVPGRLARARADGFIALDLQAEGESLPALVRASTDGRGPDAVIDAVGMEAHGAPLEATIQRLSSLLPDPIETELLTRAGIDRMSALHLAIELVRRGGTVSIVGVYGGMIDPMPMMKMFDKQLTFRMGQANVRRWVDAIMPLVIDSDVLGTETFASHHVPLDDAPSAYRAFQRKDDDTFKVLFHP